MRFKGLVIASQKKKQKKKKAPGIKAGGAGVSRFLKKKFCPEIQSELVMSRLVNWSSNALSKFFFKTVRLDLDTPKGWHARSPP